MTTSIASLLKQTSLDDHEEVLRLADKTLSQDKDSLTAQHVKAVALLKLDRFQDALQVFESAGPSLKSQARLEWAYTLYKIGRLEEATQVAGEEGTRRSLKHVQAQALYRAEKFDLVANIYDTLAKARSSDQPSDLRINSSANDAQLGWAGNGHLARKTKPDREDMEHFETAFNAACGYISRGELKQAEMLLNRARDLCKTSDELSEEDKQAELGPIMAQQLYVASRLGKTEEAQKLAESLDGSSTTDTILKQIIHANTTSVGGSQSNPYLAQRQAMASVKTDSTDHAFRIQEGSLQQNQLALDLQLGKYNGVAASTLKTLKKDVDSRVSPSVVRAGVFNAAAHARNQPAKAAIKEVLPLLEQRPYDVGLILIIVQLYVLTNNDATALALLEQFLARLESSTTAADNNARFSPGLIAILVSLYARHGRTSSIKSEMSKAAAYWRNKPQGAQPPTPFLIAAGVALLDQADSSDYEAAETLFRNVLEQDPSNQAAAAGLAASARNVTSVSQDTLSRLPAIEKLTSNIDAAALESAGVARLPTTSIAGTKRPAPSDATKPSSKKHKKAKLPKDYDPNKQPDPERWLPLRDRSNWRPKGKKKGGRSQGGMATQGGLVSEESSRPGTPSAGVVQEKKAAASKKKKGKR